MIRRRLAPEARRAELLAAATDVLREQGTAAARVEDVTRRAGVAKGTFYLYFDSWEDLLSILRDEFLVAYRDDIFTRMQTVDDWIAFIDDEVDRFLDYQQKLGPLHDVLFHSARTGPIQPGVGAPGLIRALIIAGQNAGAIPRDIDHEPTASLLFHAMHGAADDIAAGADRGRTVAVLRRAVHAVLGAGS